MIARQQYLGSALRRIVAGAVAVSLVVIMGCVDRLPERVPVAGTVFIDGKPLTKGSIMVIPDGERPAGGSIGPDGRFQLTSYELNDGVIPGTHRVRVQATEHVSERETRWLAPKKYSNPDISGITITITEPTDDLKIELSWDGKGPFVEKM